MRRCNDRLVIPLHRGSRDRSKGSISGTLICLVAVALFALGCGTSGTNRPNQTETRDEFGFTIVEDVRIGVGVRSNFEEALTALNGEDYPRGIELLEEVAEDVPNSTTVHINLSIAYALADDLEQAESSIDRALELNPRHPAAHNQRGVLHRRSGRFDAAKKSYEKALSLFPDYHVARRNLAILCDLYLEDPECALESYETYLETFPDDPEASIWIADLRNRLGR
jgi:tetratricopeptide (TPR) repeat protein